MTERVISTCTIVPGTWRLLNSLSAEDLGIATSSFKGRKIMFFDMALANYREFIR